MRSATTAATGTLPSAKAVGISTSQRRKSASGGSSVVEGVICGLPELGAFYPALGLVSSQGARVRARAITQGALVRDPGLCYPTPLGSSLLPDQPRRGCI